MSNAQSSTEKTLKLDAGTPKADLLTLMRARIDGTTEAQRQIVRRPVCLRPSLRTARAEAILAGDTEVVARADAEIAASSIMVTLMPLTPTRDFEVRHQIIAEYKSSDDTPMASIWSGILAEAFVRATSMDGDPLEVTGKEWRKLVDTLSEGELAGLFTALTEASSVPSFPS